MTRMLPVEGSRSHKLLIALLDGPGTFYQICERAGYDIEQSDVEPPLRKIFDHMIGGHVRLSGIVYSLTTEARNALSSPAAPYVGQAAGPAYRGTHDPRTVFIVRRSEGAHA